MKMSLESLNIKRILRLFIYQVKNHTTLTESKSKKGFTWDKVAHPKHRKPVVCLILPHIQHFEWD